MRISDWSSVVCSSDLAFHRRLVPLPPIVRKLLCIAIDSMTRKESGHFSNDAASPINHCPECIEQHRPDERQRPRSGSKQLSSPADGERDNKGRDEQQPQVHPPPPVNRAVVNGQAPAPKAAGPPARRRD